MDILDIRNAAPNEEIDYLFLTNCLRDYSQPRVQINRMLKKNELIRVKKGLYIFGPKYARKPIVKETLANLIYGPSYISLEYALAFYNMIPERVTVVTSVTCKRNKQFHTPVGDFTYRYLQLNKYQVGITRTKIDDTHAIIIATPEKAFADQIALASPGLELQNAKDGANYLYEDLRIAPEWILKLNLQTLTHIAKAYKNKNIDFIANFLKTQRMNK